MTRRRLPATAPYFVVAEHVGEGGGALARLIRLRVIADHWIRDRGQAAVDVLRIGGVDGVLVVGIGAENVAAGGDGQQAGEAVVRVGELRPDGIGLGGEAVVRVVGVGDAVGLGGGGRQENKKSGSQDTGVRRTGRFRIGCVLLSYVYPAHSPAACSLATVYCHDGYHAGNRHRG